MGGADSRAVALSEEVWRFEVKDCRFDPLEKSGLTKSDPRMNKLPRARQAAGERCGGSAAIAKCLMARAGSCDINAV